MTKKPIHDKNHYSEPRQWLLGSNGHLLEIRPSSLMLMGPQGLWAGFWAQSSTGTPITSSRQWLKKADIDQGVAEFKLTNRVALSCHCGDIKRWRSLQDRSLDYVRRHHPEQARANHSYLDSRHSKSSYLSGNSRAVEIEQTADLGRARVYFSGAKTKASTIWRSRDAKRSYRRSLGDYLFNQVLLPDTSWQDPEPWLMLVENHDVELAPAFKRQVFKKLVGQFNSDFDESSSADLQSQLLKRARQGWWSVNPTILSKLASGTEILRDPSLTKPLNDYLRKLDVQEIPISHDLRLAWFDNFLPLSRPPLFTGLPLDVAEYMNFLHNSSKEEKTI